MANVTRIFDQFLLATAVLTRLPVGWWSGDQPPLEGAIAAASWAFPAVGAGVGMIAAIALFLAAALQLGGISAALFALVAAALITGALHEDGLADTLDGFGGGRTRDEKLAIMHDSRSGAYGVLGLIFSVGLRAAALITINSPIGSGLALIAAHTASRAALPVMMHWLAPARADGLGATAGTPGPMAMLVALAIGIFVAIGMLGPIRGPVALIAAGVAVIALAALARRQIGGYTGDVLGAFQQIGEIVMLLVAAAR
ncbi:MAG TPA: adenosylcobinamide-GDP ribazoletransferase [Stellaceae bacterium]|nr:adenosylcobinamide-GDP ribazoletransferase [Stellaceae bacterium]